MKKNFFDIIHLNNTFKTILIYTLTPCFLMVVFSFIFLFYSTNLQISTHITQSSDKIESVYKSIEHNIKNISTSFNLYDDDTELLKALRDSESSVASVKKMQTVLNSLCSKIPYIDSAIIYNKASDKIITSDNVYTISDYLLGYNYADYSREFWDSYHYSISKQKFLSPTTVIINGKEEKKLIVPLVYSRLGKNYLNKLIIFNIDFGAILSDEHDITSKSNYSIGIINRLTKTFYSPVYDFAPQPLTDELNTIFRKNTTYSGIHTFNDEKALIVYTAPSKSALGYSYFTTLPYSEILNQAVHPTMLLIILILSASILAIFIGYKFSKKTYEPIKQIEKTLNPNNNNNNNNSFETINRSISEMQEKNQQLSLQYENSLSKIQNMYLINLLNTDNDTISDDISSYFDFKHNYYCSVIYSINLTSNIEDEYSHSTYETLLNNLFSCIYAEYLSIFDTFTLPAENNVYYILLNVTSPDVLEQINTIRSTIDDFLSVDKEILEYHCAVGGIYEGLSGLKKSHNAALFLIDKHIVPAQHSKPSVKIQNRKNTHTHTFDFSKESALTGYLAAFKTELARELIETAINENMHKNLSQSQLSKMYVQIITAIIKVLDSKKIEHCILENESILESTSDLLSMPLVELNSIVFKLLDVFEFYVSSHSNTFDIVNIVNHIDENYNTDISLEAMATIFKTSTPYLSRLIKSKLGITFSEYLSKVRIEHAIELMKTENITINELYLRVGFTHRNGFTTAFKRVTGTTPSEYKKNKLN